MAGKIGASSVLIVVAMLMAASAGVFIVIADDGKQGTVKNDAMNIIGNRSDGVVSFLGIPYAEAPVGDLRFAPPVEKRPWTETLDCTKYGNSPIQVNAGLEPGRGEISEDCLCLNIWAPADARPGDNLPVFVWIFGGGWSKGACSQEYYNGSEFARDGVIVVDISYRLGTLGYLSLGVLKDLYGTTGNWGTLDQIMALEWVNRNISSFGGDCRNITVGGESAGSYSAFYLMMSERCNGLFQNVVLESGAYRNPINGVSELRHSIDMSAGFAAQFGVSDDLAGLQMLREADPIELWEKGAYNADYMVDSEYVFGPVMDGSVLPLSIYDTLKNGTFNKNVNVLIGDNLYEGDKFVNAGTLTQDLFEKRIDDSFLADPQGAKDYYAAQTGAALIDKAKEMIGLSRFSLGIAYAEKVFADAGMNVYVYNFTYTDSRGATARHADEMCYVFGHDYVLGKIPMSGEDLKVSHTMHRYWVNFMKNGDPNSDGLAKWTEYVDGKHTDIMRIDSVCMMENRHDGDVMDALWGFYFLP